jgi:large subunit ribosomal protein L30
VALNCDRKEADMAEKLQITWVKSNIAGCKKFEPVLRGIGLKRLNQTVIRSNTPEIRGMVKKVLHMVTVEEINE